jgi:ABC-type multidrug transport system fused ATPase/permease subunit
MGGLIFSVSSMVSGIAISFYYGPEFAAACFTFFPIIIMLIVLISKLVKKAAMKRISYVKKLGGIMEESLSSISIV